MQPLVPTHQTFLSLFAAALLGFTLPAQHGEGASGTTPLPAGHPPVERPGASAPASASPAAATAPAAGQDPTAKKAPEKPKKRPEKPGIPVEDLLVQSLCVRCHFRDERNHMTRISYIRKSPEGWAQSIKRMGRLHGLQLTPATAKMLVRSLSNSHGLSRSEAQRGLYESERRVHWSEEHHDADFKRACAQCHPLGRALLQYRDKEEWQLLRATHVAMFPLSRGQMGGGPPRETSSSRGGFPGNSGAPPSSANASSASSTNRRGGGNTSTTPTPPSNRRGGGSGVGDRVLDQLSKDQPLFTPEWEAWTQNKREVPLQGTWSVHGHETGRGDIIGTLEMKRTGADEYDLTWNLNWSDGSSAVRTGKGVLYAGYSWRGRTRGKDGVNWREVLLLDDQWQKFTGRVFTGNYDEIGFDVTLDRDLGRTRILALGNASVPVPAKDHALDVYGEGFGADVQASDFFIGQGLTVTGAERKTDRHVVLRVSAAPGTKLGTRSLAYGPRPGSATVTLYDTVDYVRVRPLQGLSRNGGGKNPRQLERFEAYAVHRGKDGKPYTKDDVDLFQVRGKWALAEFAVRDDDDDLQYVGAIDATTGVFTPNIDGPNPKRKWQANNVGDVFVTFETSLDVPVRPPEKKKKEADDKDGESKDADSDTGGSDTGGSDTENKTVESKEGDSQAKQAPEVAAREVKKFFARSHLIVTVPIYVRWQVLDWEDR